MTTKEKVVAAQALSPIKRLFASAVLAVASLLAMSPEANADVETEGPAAAALLAEICARDGGALWGASLCGPLLVVAPQTRDVWASAPDQEGRLTASAGGWRGVLPRNVGLANTAMRWAGVHWVMVLSPLSADRDELGDSLAHEAWHRIQASIGLPSADCACAHLETERGRYLMRIELRALAAALSSTGRARTRAARDALAFRTIRIVEFRAQSEAALDRNEGLAAYTGLKLGVMGDRNRYAVRRLQAFDTHPAYARSYAYATGPAYGLLLDEHVPGWRRRLGNDSPADLLTRRLARSINTSAALARASAYGGAVVAQQERDRERARATRDAEIRRRFTTGQRLELNLTQAQMEYDPNRVTPVQGLGNYYATLTLRDAWGHIEITTGAIIAPDFSRVTVDGEPTEAGRPRWSLSLAPGYRIGAADAQGVRRVERAP